MAAGRLPQLDLLRGVAILLVLFRHMGKLPDNPLLLPLNILEKGGWLGVDLFFVLSGFLVSGLVIKEYLKYKSFDAWRFFVRRGFKIYPAYYAFLLLALPAVAWVPHLVTAQTLLDEACFVQNLLPGIWGHTWSLAIEEQFYLLLCLGFFVLSRRGHALKWLVAISIVCMIAPLIARLIMYQQLDPATTGTFYVKPLLISTMLRLDGLAFGVLLSCFYHLDGETLEKFVRRHCQWLLPFGLALVAPCFFLGCSSFFLYVFGLTMVYLGCGVLLLVCLFCMSAEIKGLLATLAKIGFYSYSIYLWHKPLTAIFDLPAFDFVNQMVKPPLFVLCSIAIGVLMSVLIEQPALKMRERLFPSRSGTMRLPAEALEAKVS